LGIFILTLIIYNIVLL